MISVTDIFEVLRDELERDETHTPPEHLPYIEGYARRVKEALASFGPATHARVESLANKIASESGHEITVEVARAMIAEWLSVSPKTDYRCGACGELDCGGRCVAGA